MILFFFQALVGLVIGFYTTDKKRGVSFKEMRFGVIVMMIVASAMLFTSEPMSFHSIVTTIICAFVLFGSIFAGEYIHIRLIESVLKSIQKENIHATVRRFVETAKTAACAEGVGKEFMDAELYRTINYLKGLAERAKCFKQKELANQIQTVADSCVTLSRLSVQIKNRQDESYQRYEQLADQLLAISWETLSHTEEHIQRDLGKSWNTIAFAVKTAHMK